MADARAGHRPRALLRRGPLLNGYSSYWPEQYPRSMSLAARLPEDGEALAILRQETGVNLVLVWPNELLPGKRNAWTAVAGAPDPGRLVLLAQGDQGALLFRVRGAPPAPATR